MSEAKHTPGPWTTDEADHDAPYQNIKIQASNRTICTVWIDDAPVRDFNSAQQANARLVVAAPELLEALLVAHKHITEDRASYVWGAELPDGSMDTKDAAILHEAYDSKLAQIEAAIAKATNQ